MVRRMQTRTVVGIGTALLGAVVYTGASAGCGSDDTTSGDDASAPFESGTITPEPDAFAEEDSGTCRPNGAPVSTASPQFAALAEKACTSAQIADYATMCFDTVSADHAACSAFLASAANQSCAGCLVGAPGAAVQGPIVSVTLSDGVLPTSNVGGCIAALDPSQAACGEATAASDQCALAQCAGCSESTASLDELDECLTVAAYDDGCMALQTAEDTCQTALPPGSAGRSCLYFYGAPSNEMLDDAFILYASAVCGGAVATDAGGASDAGGDAGDGG
jgi:hypothetical protein